MPFKPGVSGNPSGKAKGTKNRNFLSLQFWFKMIAENADRMSPEKKIEIGFRAANLLVPKMVSLPQEPGDSVDNANAALEMLKTLENPQPKTEGQ